MEKQNDILIGIDYFAGWWEEEPNFWLREDGDWREQYPERVPLLGCYNAQETMDAEIDAAADYGVDFFLFLWYPYSHQVATNSFRGLNDGIRNFMASKNAHRMKFAMEYCNHEPYPPLDDAIWDGQCRLWCSFMRHESYLKVGDKPFYKIHGVNHFLTQHKDDGDKAAQRIARLREIARQEGIGEILICAGAVGDAPIEGALAKVLAQCDCHGTYGELPEIPQKQEPYPYEMLREKSCERWRKSVEKPFLPYIPSLMVGWDPRPWKDERASYALPDREQWSESLRRIKHALQTEPALRVPDGTPQGQAMFTIYSWNEYGEGGFVAPSAGERYMKLEAIAEVFERRKAD